MKVVLKAGDVLVLSEFEASGFEVETEAGAEGFSAIPMFITSLGLCTASVLESYGSQIGVSSEHLRLEMKWSYEHKPFRIASIQTVIDWPELPVSRLEAARRAAGLCTLHHTLETLPKLKTVIREPGSLPEHLIA